MIVTTFYHFFDFSQYVNCRSALLELLKKHHIKGSLLIAAEGFNGTLAGTRESIDAVLYYLKHEIVHGEFEHKESVHETQPFGRAKVRLKKETISLGEPVSMKKVGQYVEPKDWNTLISDPNTIVLDARNSYETHLGTFENAIDPKTRTFKELPEFVKKHLAGAKSKKIAAFCTGGIRCEKLTAWMKDQGFENVYHLKGGILKYLEEIPAEKSLWHGECYVFDERVAVGHGLRPSSTASSCNACGHTLKEEERKHPLYIESVSCPYCTKI
jgi:UPF0176 protein